MKTEPTVKPPDDEDPKPQHLKGFGVSPGVVMGPAFVLFPDQVAVVERSIPEEAVPLEIERLEAALAQTRGQIKAIQQDLESKTSLGEASILDAHLMVLDDRAFLDEVMTEIRRDRVNAEAVVRNASERYASAIESVKDEYLRERGADVRDVARRIIRALVGHGDDVLAGMDARSILIAPDLPPSLTASLAPDRVLAIATDIGSATSHTAVMARSMEIPAVVGLKDASRRISPGDFLILDGDRGIVVVNPTPGDLEEFGRMAEERRSIREGLVGLHDMPAETPDGRRVILSANIEGLHEVDAVLEYGAEGIGLFRSEYLFLSRGTGMTEDEQFEIYCAVARRLAPSPVIIRTMDLGGDKFMPEGPLRKEANPFLGCRSIRMSLMFPEHFKVQLRAILRASAVGNVKVMYPMIANVAEVVQANALLEECKGDLARRGVPFSPALDVGVMIEIPAAALTAASLARHVNFFSIGTNDLVQYTLAVDRVNEQVGYLYEPTHPAVLKLMKMSIDAAHAAGIWVGICGEVAADPRVTPLLLGLGLDELSVAPAAVPVIKDVIRSLEYSRAKELAETALACSSGSEVLDLCRSMMASAAPELLRLTG
jgi:phosphotransferase system enzyme I (PtsI)